MKKKYFLMIPAILLIVGMNCGTILNHETTISGTVVLSDNPSTGHGDVLVAAELITTITDKDGAFVLEGNVLSEGSIKIEFTKENYRPHTIKVDIEYPESGKSVSVDVGTIELERIGP